jgi:hypothetical protein
MPAASQSRFLPVAPATRAQSLIVKLLPIITFELYLLGSLLAFVFIPIDEIYVAEPRDVILFALAGQAMILLGYLVGIRRPASVRPNRIPVQNIIKTTIVVGVVVFSGALIWRVNSDVSLWTALTDPGTAYNARLKALDERVSVPVFAVVRGITGPILAMFLPVGVLYRRQLSPRWKILWTVGLALFLLGGISTGAAKGLFDVTLTLPWFIAAFWLSRSGQFGADRARGRLVNITFDVLLVAIVTFFAMYYFNASRQSRYGLKGDEFPAGTTTWIQENHQVNLSPATQYKAFMFVKYWSGGYKGLAECLKLPFEPCYGVGHSLVLSRYVDKVNPTEPKYFQDRSYPARAERASGYSAAYYWHTIYPWLASDITFPGALLFMGLMGYLFARAWIESLAGLNPFAIAFLGQILLMFYYIPCNNIRLAFSEEVISFWGLLLAWFLTSGSSVLQRAPNANSATLESAEVLGACPAVASGD